VTVDYSKPKQTIAGFGASITWVAGDINGFAPADQTAILDALYSTTTPSAGLSIIRAGSMHCQFNSSAGTYNRNDPSIQGEISWINRGLSNLATPPSTVTPFRTSSTENQAPLNPILVSGGSFTITIPASSIVTLVG